VTIEQTPTRRERKKLETRQALEQAALRLFGEKGYDQTTVEDIAEAADVAVRTFFRYFSSKQDVLFGEVVTDRISRLRTELANRPQSEDVLASVIAVMNVLNFTPAEAEQVLARMELMRRQPTLVTRYLEIIDELRTVVVEYVAERTGIDSKQDLYPMLVAGAWATVWDAALKVWVESGGQQSLPTLWTEGFTGLTQGLHRPPS
jgi:AcrR family transcriptional regulator